MENGKDTDMDRDLNSLFDAARSDAPAASDRLMDAILRDARAEMPKPEALAPDHIAPIKGVGWFRNILSGLGGWQGVTALAASACFGVWVGYAVSDNLSLISGDYAVSSDTSDGEYALYSDIDDLLAEG